MDFQNIKFLSDLKDTPQFNVLKSGLTKYNWFSDPAVVSTRNTNPANHDSIEIQILPSALMRIIRPKIVFKYSESTINVLHTFNPMVYYIQRLYPTYYWFRSHMVSILPKGKQKLHVDELFWHKYTLRLVLPIITNPVSYTYIGGTHYSLSAGSLYEMDNIQPHYSANMGDELRTFMFFDLIHPDNQKIIEDHYLENGNRKRGVAG